ncbi:MAG: hypothetical protein ACFFBD_17950 [Candidatus Hodarchaeota archaeon]
MKNKLFFIGCVSLIFVLIVMPISMSSAAIPPEIGQTGYLVGEITMEQMMAMTMLIYMDSSKALLLSGTISNGTLIDKMLTNENWTVSGVTTDTFSVDYVDTTTENATGSYMYTESDFYYYNGTHGVWLNMSSNPTPIPSTQTQNGTQGWHWNESYIPYFTEDTGTKQEGEDDFYPVFFKVGSDFDFPLFGSNLTYVIDLVWVQDQPSITRNINGADRNLGTIHWRGTNISSFELDPETLFGGPGGGGPNPFGEMDNLTVNMNWDINYYWEQVSRWLLWIKNDISLDVVGAYEGDMIVSTPSGNVTYWVILDIDMSLKGDFDLYFAELSVLEGLAPTPGFLAATTITLGVLVIASRAYKKKPR